MPSALAKIAARLRGHPAGIATADPAIGLDLLEPADRAIVERALPYTMTGIARLLAVVDAVRHLVAHDLDGDFAECGVWQGGSVLAMILTLQELGREDRDIHLYDTFEGMTEPGPLDVSPYEASALDTYESARAEGRRPWAGLFDATVFDEDGLRACSHRRGIRANACTWSPVPVEQTIPAAAPERLALLRLDTDWYESTRHELEHLYPRLVTGGVLIVDDYGHWAGRQASGRRVLRRSPAAPAAGPDRLHRADRDQGLSPKRASRGAPAPRPRGAREAPAPCA